MILNEVAAEVAAQKLWEIFEGKPVVAVTVEPNGRVKIRSNYRINKIYRSGRGVAVCDDYGVMTGSNDLRIEENERSVIFSVTNAWGETYRYAWALMEPDGENFQAFHKARREIQNILWEEANK